MEDAPKFSSSALIKTLETDYGDVVIKEKIAFRKSRDVSKFLKAKEKSVRESRKVKMRFK